ncbi:MAG: protein kinase, partial [Candidatus Eisenbacteria bacterium]|nr:protein kinase [Candidatus Latescibacterota bacterium]MBD3300872.1 protein kinase [Candidatus Eisenbacteria bacterium]
MQHGWPSAERSCASPGRWVMKARDDFLEALGLEASDGATTDWDEARASAEGRSDRKLVEDLRSLSMIADYYRRRRRESDPSGSEPWSSLEILEEIGRGSYGTVYRARDTQLRREVALKVVHGPESGRGIPSSILEEGERMARVKHPNLLMIHGAQVHAGRVGLTMEFIRGTTLHDLIQDRGPLSGREAILLGCDLCGALAALHAAGLIHRDIKARNVMREEGGRIVLMDLGTGIDLRKKPDVEERGVSGTPLYMAPELLSGASGSVQSDIYSLGVLLYFAVSGTYPVAAESPEDLRRRHARGERRPLRDARPDLPSGLIAVIERALAPEPADRYRSAGEMEQALASSTG